MLDDRDRDSLDLLTDPNFYRVFWLLIVVATTRAIGSSRFAPKFCTKKPSQITSPDQGADS
jgi:hypothetical protein